MTMTPTSTVFRKTMIGKLRAASRAGLFCTAACLTLIATVPSFAQGADEEKSFDAKILEGILKGVGLRDDRANIEYRERSPLVIPPGNALPAPAQSAASNNPNWPVDPEIKQERAAKSRNSAGLSASEITRQEAQPLRPDQLAVGRRTQGRAASANASANGSSDNTDRVLMPSELGSKGGIFGSLFSKDEEVVPFTGEPPRASLISPPRGYQTPSPTQPYGVGRAKATYESAADSFTSRVEAKN